MSSSIAHPSWCDPQRCGAESVGVAYHLSTPVSVTAPYLGDPHITLAVRTAINRPPEEWSPTLVVTFTRTGGPASVEEYEIDPPEFAELLAALLDIRVLMTDPAPEVTP